MEEQNEQTSRTGEAEYIPPTALEAISRAEIDIAIATARKYPQHSPDKLSQVKRDMISYATLDQETAESCFYSLPRGGKNIQGPSVRLAEIALACYGNIRAVTRILSSVPDGDHPHVIVQAVAIDLERNIQIGIEKRRRITCKRSKNAVDEDDINLATNACSAVAFRDAVFKVIPGALIKPVFEQAKKVAIGDAKTLVDRRSRCLDTFGKMGVSKERVLAKLGHKSLEEVNLDDIETMIGLHSAIKDGELSVDEAFAPEQTEQRRPQQPKGPAQFPGSAAPGGEKAPAAPQTAQNPAAATPTPAAVSKPQAPAAQAPAAPAAEPVTPAPGRVFQQGEPEGGFDAAQPGAAPAATPETTAPQGEQQPEPGQTEAAPAQQAEQPPADGPVRAPDDMLPEIVPSEGENVAGVKNLCVRDGVTETQVVKVLYRKNIARSPQRLRDLATLKLQALVRNWHTLLPEFQKEAWE